MRDSLDMEEPIHNSLQNSLFIFKNMNEFRAVREIYIANFTEIITFINKGGLRAAIVDIIALDTSIHDTCMTHRNFFVLYEINRGIKHGKITKADLL
jgi:hypothetical protein